MPASFSVLVVSILFVELRNPPLADAAGGWSVVDFASRFYLSAGVMSTT